MDSDELITKYQNRIRDLEMQIEDLTIYKYRFSEADYKKYTTNTKARLRRAEARLIEEEARM